MHVVVVGAGIIGLATAYRLLKDGAQVTVIDRDPDGDKVSFGNAGGIAVTEMVPAFGHGHLGLTQAATTGRLVSELVLQKPASLDMTPFGIERFA